MLGAVSAGAMRSTSGIWGRQESYQMVPLCAVAVPPASSAMLVAEAYSLSLVVTMTMSA